MEFLDPKLEDYVNNMTQDEPELLKQLNRETWEKVPYPRMLAGHMQGRALSMLSHMIQPKCILEIGTYTGYSAICWAEGLQEGGVIHTIDVNEELEDMVRNYLDRAGLSEQVNLHIGNALEIIPTIEETPDIVYIDADKPNYANYYDLVIDRLKPGGYVIADNVLWSGKVIDEPSTMDSDTKALMDYSAKIQADDRVQNVLFPIRDGLMIARKL